MRIGRWCPPGPGKTPPASGPQTGGWRRNPVQCSGTTISGSSAAMPSIVAAARPRGWRQVKPAQHRPHPLHAADLLGAMDRVQDPRVRAAGEHHQPLARHVDDDRLVVVHIVVDQLIASLIVERLGYAGLLERLARHVPRGPAAWPELDTARPRARPRRPRPPTLRAAGNGCGPCFLPSLSIAQCSRNAAGWATRGTRWPMAFSTSSMAPV